MQRWIVLLLLALVAPGALGAQAATGRITGVVTAEGGRPVPGANLLVSGTRLGAVAGTDGRYTINGVPAARPCRAR